MSYKNILMAVEPDFHTSHVGVLRVIRYHFKDLVTRGHSVTLATHKEGKWVTCSLLDAARAMLGNARPSGSQKPYWENGQQERDEVSDLVSHPAWTIDWDKEVVSPEQFDESVLTNPWLCSVSGKSISDSPFSTGIVYDMIPNLIALGVLRMPQFIDIYKFANDHHIGYNYFLRNVKTISCISENTRQDFTQLYSINPGQKIEVCIPFADFGTEEWSHNDPAARDVLMINVLDHRKNFLTVAKSLKEASTTIKLNVVIVGRERLPRDEVVKFLSEISQVCASVRWYRSPSDVQLQELMSKAKVVFFPSFYEGLGLPILEAQARGVPVISSNNSSCGEINMNSVLTAGPYEHKEFSKKLVAVLNNDLPIMVGSELRDAQISYLNGRNKLFMPAEKIIASEI